jgi:PAS domain S-box-containing protein
VKNVLHEERDSTVIATLRQWVKKVADRTFRLNQLNIGPRLVLCFMLIILAMSAGSVVLIWQFQQARVQAERLTGVDQELIAVLQAHISLMSLYERLDVLAHSEDTALLLKQVETLHNALLQESQRSRTVLSHLSPEVRLDPMLLPTLLAIQEELPAQLESITTLAKSGDWNAVRLRLANQVWPLESRSFTLVENVDREVGEQRAQAVLNIRQAQRRILLIVPITAAITLLFAAFLGLVITRSITRPLGRLMEGSTALASGDFSHRVPTAGNDEIMRLGSVFNEMTVKLQELYRELELIINTVPALAWSALPDGSADFLNQYFVSYIGLPLEQLQGWGWTVAVHPDDLGTLAAGWQSILASGKPGETEARLRRFDGEYRRFLFRAHPMRDKSGSIIRWFGINTDIEDRTRIAQDLHDTLLQSFIGASMQLGAAMISLSSDSPVKPKLDHVLERMQQGIEEGRKTIQGLRSTVSRPLDLVVALSAVRHEFSAQLAVDFRVTVIGQRQSLRSAIQHEIYRLGREALVNAFCHSRAERIELELEYANSNLTMRVRDNGCGIDPQVLNTGREGHWGLTGMRERAARIGGLLKISSSPTAGTEIKLSIPSDVAFQPSPADLGRVEG